MALTITNLGGSFDTLSGTHTTTQTPALNSQILIVFANTGSTDETMPTDNNADGLGGVGGYAKIDSALKNSSLDKLVYAIRKNFIGSATSTVFTQAPGGTTGGGLQAVQILGLQVAGLSSVRQSAKQENQPANGTPTLALNRVPRGDSGMVTTVFAGNSAGITAPPGYSSCGIDGYLLPTTARNTQQKGSGETNSNIVWGQSAGEFSAMAVEFGNITSRDIIDEEGVTPWHR